MEDLEARLRNFLSPEEYKQVVLQEKNIYEIFPSAEELTKQKSKEEDEKNLWKIYLQLKDTSRHVIRYIGELSGDCIEFLKKKGYQVYQQWQPATMDGGDSTIYYEIRY